MDFFLEQLYQIQLLRDYLGPAGITFMNAVSQNMLSLLGIIPLYIFWCCDKKAGYTMAFSVSVGSLVNHLMKLTFCIERPWLLDQRIQPPEIAIKNQGGYSFPSGHAQLASGYLTGTAFWIRKKRVLSFLCILSMILIGFSRVYLGVHTSLDVIVGIFESIILLMIFTKLIPWFWNDRKHTNLLSAGLIALAAISALYFSFKPYPMHYDDFGNLLTNPKDMVTFTGVGATIDFAIGLFLEKRFINFSTDISAKHKLFRLLIGVILYLPFYYIGNKFMVKIVGGIWNGFFFNIILWIFTLAGYPFLFNRLPILGGGKDR